MDGDYVETILSLTNQLEGSEYYEDKLAALKGINVIANQNAFVVGVYALEPIINAMETMDDITIHKGLLGKIFRSRDKEAFIEILIKRRSNVEILFDRYKETQNLCKIVSNGNGECIFNILKDRPVIHDMVDNIENSVCFLYHFITPANKEFFIYEGLLEKLIDVINENNYKDCLKTIEYVLHDSIRAQVYFLELDWIPRLKNYNIVNICTNLMNSKNGNLKRIQALILSENLIYLEDGAFLHNFIFRNPTNLVEIENTGFDIYRVLSDMHEGNSNNLITLELFSEVVKFKKVNINKIINQRYFYIILSVAAVFEKETRIHTDIINNALYLLSQYSTIEPEVFYSIVLFLIFISHKNRIDQSYFNVLNEIYRNKSLDMTVRSLVLLLIILTTDNYDYFGCNTEIIKDHLRYLRDNLSHTTHLLTESMLSELHKMLFTQLNKFSVVETFYDEYEEKTNLKILVKITNAASKAVLEKEENVKEVVTDAVLDGKKENNLFKNTIASGKERIKNFIERRKVQKNEDDEVFDL